MNSGESTKWPTGAILGYGTFDTKTPAGRRYLTRAGWTLLLLLIVWPGSLFLDGRFPDALFKIVAAMAPGVAFSYIAWEARRYWLTLDELARRLMLESAAWTYLFAVAGGALLGGISFAFPDYPWIWFWCNPFWVILLEVVRAVILYRLSQRY